MPAIGYVQRQDDGTFKGQLRTLSVRADIELVPNRHKSGEQPDYRVLAVPTPDGSPSSCMAGRYYIHLDANGDVHPCGLHTGTFRAKNLLRDGFEAALLHARRHDCGDCCLAYLNERKAVFGLHPRALIEVIRRA